MQDIQKTRFLAANYVNLQGLKAVPLGLLLLVVVLWANTQAGPGRSLAFPLLASALMLALAWAVQRYYDTRFGKVITSSRQRRLDILLGLGGGLVALAAFLADVYLHLPFSCIGLVFAASFVVEYWRMQVIAPGRYLLPNTLIYTLLLLGISFLPLLGLDGWWEQVGLQAQLLGVLVAASVVIIFAGFFGHWFFVRQLPVVEAER